MSGQKSAADQAALSQLGAGAQPSWLPRGGLSLWLASLAVHCAALGAVGISASPNPQGAAAEVSRESGIALVARHVGRNEYLSGETATLAGPGDLRQLPEQDAAAALPGSAPPLLPGPQLPASVVSDSTAARRAGSLPGAGESNLTDDLSGKPTPDGRGAPATWGRDLGVETQVFGVKGKGSKFVYVFDRSSSMEGAPLAAAKRELVASLATLQSVHQFQIVFYNQEPQIMAVRSQPRQLAFADEPGKRLAASFIGSITAYGATDHMQALRAALRMRPDVIFFLTDADEPQLTTADFETIRRLNQGTLINAIEFGVGPPRARFNFLVQLAAEHGGQHAYVDVTRLGNQ